MWGIGHNITPHTLRSRQCGGIVQDRRVVIRMTCCGGLQGDTRAPNSAFATVQITTDLLSAVHQKARLLKLSYRNLITMQLDQALSVIAMSFFVSILTEFISWLLVYRTSNYRRLKDDLDRQAKKFEQYKQQTGPKKDGSEKKEKKLEEGVKSSIRDYQAIRMKANMVTGLVNLLVLNRLLAAFEGTPGMQRLASDAGPA